MRRPPPTRRTGRSPVRADGKRRLSALSLGLFVQSRPRRVNRRILRLVGHQATKDIASGARKASVHRGSLAGASRTIRLIVLRHPRSLASVFTRARPRHASRVRIVVPALLVVTLILALILSDVRPFAMRRSGDVEGAKRQITLTVAAAQLGGDFPLGGVGLSIEGDEV